MQALFNNKNVNKFEKVYVVKLLHNIGSGIAILEFAILEFAILE
jgi:hypothetical protein